MIESKNNSYINSWGVGTISSDSRVKNIQQEMKGLKANIIQMSETRWRGTGITTSDNYKVISDISIKLCLITIKLSVLV